MEEGFRRVLAASRSPVRALAGPFVPQVISVAPGQAGLELRANANWHEGWLLGTLRPDGTLARGEENVDYPPPVIASDTAFTLTVPGAPPRAHSYAYVGNADAEVARLALVGRYRAPDGSIVEFAPDGSLTGLGAPGRYSLENDHVAGPEFDYFMIERAGVAATPMAFRHVGGSLVLHRLRPASAAESVGRPDLIIGRPDPRRSTVLRALPP